MSETFVEKVLKNSEKTNRIDRILEVDSTEYIRLMENHKKKIREILFIGSFTKAGIELLKWLGFREEDIDLEKLTKAILVVKLIVALNNRLAEKINREMWSWSA